MDPQPPRLSQVRRFGYAVGHVQNDVCASMWFTYLLIFFQNVLGWPPHVAGIIMLIGQIADALATPFVGLQADRKDKFWLCRYGRRKTWHLVGTICVLLSFPFLFSPCIGCRNAPGDYWDQLVYFGAFVIVFQFGWAAVQIAHLSLIPDLTPDQHTRTSLIAYRNTFTVLASVLVYVITWATFHLSSGEKKIGPEDGTSFQIVVAAGLGVGIVCSILFHVLVKETSVTDAEDEPTKSDNDNVSAKAPVAVQKTVKEHLCSVPLYQVAAVYMCTRLYVNLSQVYTPLYLQEQGLGAESLAIVPLVMFLSSFFTSFLTRPMNKYLGRKIAHCIGCFLGAAGCLWVWLGAGQIYTQYEVYAVAILLGASSSIQLVTSLGLTADLIGQDTNTGAFVYGAMSFVDKLSNGIAIAILQAYFNHTYRSVLAYVCGASSILGVLSLGTLLACRVRRSSSSEIPPVQFESSYSEI